MKNIDYERVKDVIQENAFLKQELMSTLDEKEKIILLSEEIINEKESIEKKYNNLKNSKLGSLTVWYWSRKKRKGNKNVSK